MKNSLKKVLALSTAVGIVAMNMASFTAYAGAVNDAV